MGFGFILRQLLLKQSFVALQALDGLLLLVDDIEELRDRDPSVERVTA